jgi:hypothetical protein
MSLPVLLITGPVGVGKTAVAFETMELLEERDVPHAFFDVDGLTYFHPKPSDRYGERFAIDALGMLVPRLREEAGIERLILARVLWERASLDQKKPLCGAFSERRLPESNRCTGFCRPMPNHSAKAPRGGHRIGATSAGSSTSSRNAVARSNTSTRFASFSTMCPSSS